jgi:electron transfer flavoprotein alpha subunit
MSAVLVVVEHKNGALGRISLEAIAAGQTLAKMIGMECSAAVLGEGIASLAETLTQKSLARVYTVEHSLLKRYTADGYA